MRFATVSDSSYYGDHLADSVELEIGDQSPDRFFRMSLAVDSLAHVDLEACVIATAGAGAALPPATPARLST
jgi:hypothetical protein